MHGSAVQDYPSAMPYPTPESGVPQESRSVSMTTVLTKALPQEDPQVAKATPQRKRVLIVGGGFAGIAATHDAQTRANVEITLVDRRNHHIFSATPCTGRHRCFGAIRSTAPIRQRGETEEPQRVAGGVRGISISEPAPSRLWLEGLAVENSSTIF